MGKWFIKLSLPNSIKQKSSFATSLTATAFLVRNGMNLYMDKQFKQGNDSQTVTIAFKKYMQPNKTVTKNYSQNEVCVHK